MTTNIETKPNKKTSKYNNEICNDTMTFDDCEIALLRHAVDETENIQGQKKVNSEDIQKMLKIVENFIMNKQLICYGGTAINNILPKYAQFYKRDIEIPDYDFYSANALNDAKELADIYYKNGYKDVEAKTGIHHGTFKVFVNYIPIADITYMNKIIYDTISKEAITIAGIKYAPPNFLRMGMYLELSRPAGDVSRWEKVMKRLNLLNQYFPLTTERNCSTIDFHNIINDNMNDYEKINIILRNAFIDNGVIFFGGYSTHLYSEYIDDKQPTDILLGIPDFDVLSEDHERCATIIKETLIRNNVNNVQLIHHKRIDDIIPEHIEVQVGKNSLAYIYKPIACHSYNKIQIDEKTVNIATIDTILAFYLCFLYADMPYYDKDRLLCIAIYLFNIEQKNKLEQRGILKRFSIDCYGKQTTLEDMRSLKSDKFNELNNKRGSVEYEMWFLNYSPYKIYNSDINKNTHIQKYNKKYKKYNKTYNKKYNNDNNFNNKYTRKKRHRKKSKSKITSKITSGIKKILEHKIR